ncbi:MAG: M48 family metalloprotease [Kiritimatiellae bacterium]|nr:M48 family metalloprotease [Kiritimatiellia bacterium]
MSEAVAVGGVMRGGAPQLSRRQFLAAAAVGSVAVGVMGCVTNPVTGRSEFSLVSPEDEIRLDRENAPRQFSGDFGLLREPRVQRYVSSVGEELARVSHRPTMPYSFRAVRASYVNAYAFPGGSIAATRGILLDLENEAQLAGLLGHEIGHVCARHTARRMTSAILTQLAVAGAAIAVEQAGHERTATVVAGLGTVAGGALLARYSREDEREADRLGMEYMVKAGYNPQGMVGLMDLLVRQERERPSALELMFATHPMSRERRDTAEQAARTTWAAGAGLPLGRERYLDETAPLRAMAPAIRAIQEGDEARRANRGRDAETAYARALAAAPEDYEALLKMATLLAAQRRHREAREFAERARAVDPEEPQAMAVLGAVSLQLGQPERAHQCFTDFDRRLPGDAEIAFLDGLALERMHRREEAARRYVQFLQAGGGGTEAEHARRRLVEWGVIRPEGR